LPEGTDAVLTMCDECWEAAHSPRPKQDAPVVSIREERWQRAIVKLLDGPFATGPGGVSISLRDVLAGTPAECPERRAAYYELLRLLKGGVS
jgi:hypothetical protein